MILSPIPDYISRFHARDFFHVGPRPDILLPHPYGYDAFQSARTALVSTEGEVMRPVRKDHQFFFLSGILPGLKTTAGSLGEEILSEVLVFFLIFCFLLEHLGISLLLALEQHPSWMKKRCFKATFPVFLEEFRILER